MAKKKESPPKEAQAASTSAAASSLEALDGTISDARYRMEALIRARKISRIVRYVMLIAFLGVFFGWCYAIYASLRDFDVEALQKEIFEERAERIVPRMTESMLQVIDEVRPVYEKVLAEELDRASPVIGARIEMEAEILRGNVQTGLNKRLDAALDSVGRRQRAALVNAFPDLADKPEVINRMMGVIQEGFRSWVTRELTSTLDQHVEALLAIRDSLSAFKRTGGGGDSVTAEQLLGIWLEIVYERLGGDESIDPLLGATPDGSVEKKTPDKKAPAKRGPSAKKRGK